MQPVRFQMHFYTVQWHTRRTAPQIRLFRFSLNMLDISFYLIHSFSIRPLTNFRRVCPEKPCFPGLSGVRPISRNHQKELCASTALFSAFSWHGSLLAHIIS
jgi:hypothetical protein